MSEQGSDDQQRDALHLRLLKPSPEAPPNREHDRRTAPKQEGESNLKPSKAGRLHGGMMGVTFLLLTQLLTACAGIAGEDAHIYPAGLFGQRVVGNEAYVTVSNVWNEMDGLPLADQHCQKYGKIARFTHMQGSRAIYDCVKQSS